VHGFFVLVVECKIRKFLDIFKVFYRFFVKEIIKDFCWIFAYQIFVGFLGSFCIGFLAGFCLADFWLLGIFGTRKFFVGKF